MMLPLPLLLPLLFQLLLRPQSVLGGNPLVPDSGMADANIKHFEDTWLVFATHDFSPNNTHFLMRDWQVWRSADAVNWEHASTVRPQDSLAWSTEAERNECWATDAAYVNGSYFFYLSVGPNNVGVVTSDSVAGPWSDPLGHALLTSAMVPPSARYPCVFGPDNDGSYYIIAGVFNYKIAKLAPDMISLAEPLRDVTIHNAYGCCRWPTTPGASTADKPFIHKRGPTYYLSWGAFYGVSGSVYGPYAMGGQVLDTAVIAPPFRTNTTLNSSVEFLSNDYNDRHGSFLEHQNQWIYVSNDRSHSSELRPGGANRWVVGCHADINETTIASD
jgi:arabinoxylan arabinofuranohydrolase